MDQADVDPGRKPGLTSDDRIELVRLRQENRVHATKIEILKCASPCFA
jgi:transposase